MTAIIDYGVGNLFSLCSSFKAVGEEAVITSDPAVLLNADRVILPGVGAFEDASAKLRTSGMDKIVRQIAAEGTPLLGICLGMQLLFERSLEYGVFEGLGLLKGEIRPLKGAVEASLKVPHMGWNALEIVNEHPLLASVGNGDCVYFVHSFYATGCGDSTIARCEYSIPVTAAVAKGNIMGCQFHPEKSGDVGLNILRSFCKMKRGSLC